MTVVDTTTGEIPAGMITIYDPCGAPSVVKADVAAAMAQVFGLGIFLDPAAPRRPKPTKVFSVYAIQATTGGAIKIGKAERPTRRLEQLSVASPVPLRLLGAVPETAELNERSEHARLAQHRIHGEWFEITPADLPWIAS